MAILGSKRMNIRIT